MGPDDAVSGSYPVTCSTASHIGGFHACLTAASVAAPRIERLPITHPDARLLVEAVQEEYVARYGGRDETPVDPRDFEDPLGQFFVGYLDGVPVATGAWRRSSVTALGADVTAEVKRMYVVPRGAAPRAGPADARPPRGDGGGRRHPGARPRDRA